MSNGIDMAMFQQAGELGDIIGDRIAYQLNLDYRQRMEKEIVRVSAMPNLTPAQRREMVLKAGVDLRTQLGQELMQAQMGMGQYYESPLETEYRNARIEATKALTESRQGGRGIRSGAGAAGQGNLFAMRKYWTDELKKAVDVAYDKYEDKEKAYADPTVKRIEKRIRDIDNQLNPPPQADENWFQSQGHKEGEFQQPAPAPTGESLKTAEELIGPPSSLQTHFPVPVPSLEKRSMPPEPKSLEEFEEAVRRMGRSKLSRRYYDKWVHKWQ